MKPVFRFFGLLLVCLFITAAQAEQGEETAAKPDPALEAVEALGLDAEEETAAEDPLSETPMPAGETLQEPGPDIWMGEEVPVTPLEEEPPLLKDVFLVLDNSGSMKQNDPQFLAKTAVDEFIGLLDDSTRVGIIIFDQTVRKPVPLTRVTDATREEILQNLDQINYKGQYTDSPAAIERAIYDIKLSGREDARKVIVFMTDGIVD
ncbi:MAG TPA: vWA domain-containing protein, partial [Gammaproteobacteria bacterium]|nr:vWA domain-containing protein [Gammaproteobacteria bacterium]